MPFHLCFIYFNLILFCACKHANISFYLVHASVPVFYLSLGICDNQLLLSNFFSLNFQTLLKNPLKENPPAVNKPQVKTTTTTTKTTTTAGAAPIVRRRPGMIWIKFTPVRLFANSPLPPPFRGQSYKTLSRLNSLKV